MASQELLNVPEVKAMSLANTQFALDLLRRCGAEKKGKNVFVGPFSVTTALAMTCLGAEGDTSKQMIQTLRWTDLKIPLEGFSKYLPLMQPQSQTAQTQSPGYTLAGAQRIYVEKTLSLKTEFKSATQKFFHSDAAPANFSGDPESERVTINGWVTDQTKGKIQNLVPAGAITPLTALVLVQAMYFKGDWKSKFDANITEPSDFHSPGGKISVNMMRKTGSFPFGMFDDLSCSALRLAYAGDDLSMLLLLPHERDGLEKLEAALTAQALDKVMSKLRPAQVEIALPRFSVESSFAMKEVLSDLGMPQAFSENADFSKMAEGPRANELYISEVFHKAVVEVNEEGSVAAAATASMMNTFSMPMHHPFIADHPFLFLIVDDRAGVVLFSGHVYSPPTSSAKDEL